MDVTDTGTAAAPAFRPGERVTIGPIMAAILNERQRQISKGYDAAHDDEHVCSELADAAAHLARRGFGPPEWPFDSKPPEAQDRREQLVIAVALLLAEIERLERAQARGETAEGGA